MHGNAQVIFSDQLHVHGPRCGSGLGDWTDPHGDRTVARSLPS